MKMMRLSCSTMLFLLGLYACAQQPEGDLWYFQLSGHVRSITLEGMGRTEATFDHAGRLEYITHNGWPVTIHRNTDGRIDSLTTCMGAVDGPHNTKYRQRATDEHGNWKARKTQQLPYIIGTEYCRTEYYK